MFYAYEYYAHGLCVFFRLREHVLVVLLVSLECPCLIAPWVFAIVYLYLERRKPKYHGEKFDIQLTVLFATVPHQDLGFHLFLFILLGVVCVVIIVYLFDH